jgi:hypothetical protein
LISRGALKFFLFFLFFLGIESFFIGPSQKKVLKLWRLPNIKVFTPNIKKNVPIKF